MDGACKTYQMRMDTKFWSENVRERDHEEDLWVDRKIILEWILGK
jgi:hypothetical protein